MVLIVTDRSDVSSHIVAKYLTANGTPFCNLYSHSFRDQFDIATLNIDIKRYSGIWLRRGLHFAGGPNWNPSLESERKTLDDYLHFVFENSSNCIGSLYAEYNHNKLIDLKLAESNNLKTPISYLVSQKQSLIDILESDPTNNYITKALKDSIRVKENDVLIHYGYTLRIMRDFVESLPETFYPSLLQEEIEKVYEVRVFYLKGKCYAMAIFSQKNDKTQLDYRYYDDKVSNRNVPYQLESSMEEKIDSFMQSKKLNCGSIDLMVNKNGEYYFLEVNPVGQFGWLSSNCNYYIEKDIASILSNEQNE